MESWQYFLFLIILCLIIEGFFSMVEMACVSFNKVRLQYYVSQKNRRAIWLSALLNRPAQLFGTTLLAVNTVLILGSECARRFYLSLGLSPDWAPLTQVLIVLIFAEISPMLAGRRYAEHAAMFGIPVVYAASIILRPVVGLLELLCQLVNRLVKSPASSALSLSREELEKVLEQQEEPYPSKSEEQGEEFNTVVSNIFSLKNKTANELMQPLKNIQMIASTSTVEEMRGMLTSSYTPYMPVYHSSSQNIVAIAYPRDLLRLDKNKLVREYARSPWFITENSSILQILKQFRRNNQSVAVVLDDTGFAVGVLTLDEIIDEIFGRIDQWMSFEEAPTFLRHVVVDRTFPGDMRIEDFNTKFHVHLDPKGTETLQELVTKLLGHVPSKGESVRLDQFELSVEEASLLGAKMIAVRTLY